MKYYKVFSSESETHQGTFVTSKRIYRIGKKIKIFYESEYGVHLSIADSQ